MRALLLTAIVGALALLSPGVIAQHASPALHDATSTEEEQGSDVAGPGADAPGGTRRESVHGGTSAPSMARKVAPGAPAPGPSDDAATGGEEQTPPGDVAGDSHAGEHASMQQVPVDRTQVDHSHRGHAVPTQDAPADHSRMDHSRMGHAAPTEDAPVDHSQMDHSQMGPTRDAPADSSQMDHSQMDHSQMDHSQMDHSQMDHSQMDHSQHATPALQQPRTPIPALTDADRAVVYPGSHPAHDDAMHSFVLVDRLEATDGDHGRGQAWEMQAWIGKDIDKLWLRSEGERIEGRTGRADVELLYGRAVSPWWDLVAGVRHDFQPGDPQSHLAIGVIGMAPYKFEVEATAYFGESGDVSAQVEAEYDTLLTNRLILQWLAEAELHGEDDAARGVGSGLSTVEAGLRLRYEIRREFAPYIGLVRERAFGGTADLRREHGEPVDDTLVVVGVRLWF